MRAGFELTSRSVAELLALARAGALRPLPLPRGERWSDEDRRELLDTIGRGLPAGALVLARGPARAGRVTLGRLSFAAPACAEALWIVDGASRLGALMEALVEGDGPSLSLSSGELTAERVEDDAQGELFSTSSSQSVPLPVALDPARLVGWLRLHPQSEVTVEAVLARMERMRAYRFPVYLTALADLDEVSDVFERVNGERLDAVARFGLRQGMQEPGAGDALGRATAALSGLGFGVLDEDVVLKTLRALLPSGESAHEELGSALRHAESALRRAVVFLQVNGGITHEALLPYRPPLVVLGKFFHLFPRPQPEAREALRRWLWRGSLGLSLGSHTGRHLEALRAGDEAGSAARLLALAPTAPSPEVMTLEKFHMSHARCRLQLAALALLGPRGAGGELVDVESVLGEGRGGPGWLVEGASGGLVGSVANRLLHPRTSGGVGRALLGASEEVLLSQAVPAEALRALREGDTDGALRARAEAVRAVLERAFARQAEWGLGAG